MFSLEFLMPVNRQEIASFDEQGNPPGEEDAAAQIKPDCEKSGDDSQDEQFDEYHCRQRRRIGVRFKGKDQSNEGDRQPRGHFLVSEQAHSPCERCEHQKQLQEREGEQGGSDPVFEVGGKILRMARAESGIDQ